MVQHSQMVGGRCRMGWWVVGLLLGAATAEIHTLDLDSDEPLEQQPSETRQKSEIESVREMTSEFWEQLPPGVRQTAIWDSGYDGINGCWIEFFGHRVCEGNGICFFFVWICVFGCYFYGKYTYDEAVKTELAKQRLIELSQQSKAAAKAAAKAK